MAKKKQDMAAMLDGFEAAAAKEHEVKEAKGRRSECRRRRFSRYCPRVHDEKR